MSDLIAKCKPSDLWATPIKFFKECEKEYGPFDLDACALPESAKCEKYFTPEDNSFLQDWNGVIWCNPPYSGIMAWLDKGDVEILAGRAKRIVYLLPARTGTAWFHKYQSDPNVKIKFLRGRIAFGDGGSNCPWDSLLLIMELPK